MGFTEALIILIIALYAMVGGAFINAAITAPARCLRVLSWMWSEVINSFLVTGGAFFLSGLGLWVVSTEKSDIGLGVASLGMAHLSLFVLFLYARKIATAALHPTEAAELRQQKTQAKKEP